MVTQHQDERSVDDGKLHLPHNASCNNRLGGFV